MADHIPARPGASHGVTIDSDDENEIHNYQARQARRQSRAAAQKVPRRTKPSEAMEYGEDGDDQASNNEETPEYSSSDELPDGSDRHPFYNYVTEKQDSFADAKVIYQRHRLDTQTSQDLQAFQPLSKSATMPSSMDGETVVLGRSPSLTSRRQFSGPKDRCPKPSIILEAQGSVPTVAGGHRAKASTARRSLSRS